MRKLIIILFSILLLSVPTPGNTQQSSPIKVYFFYIEECQSCGGILQGYFPSLKSMYPSLEIQTFDVGTPSNYEALISLEKQFGHTGNELPVLFIGDQVLAGEQEVMEKLDPLILEYQLKGAIPLPPLEIPSAAKPSEKTFSVNLTYFYQDGCPKCQRANHLLKYLSGKYPRLKIREININTPDGKRLNETLSVRLNLPVEKRLTAPSIFIGSDSFLPGEITETKVEALIHKYERVSTGANVGGSQSDIQEPAQKGKD